MQNFSVEISEQGDTTALIQGQRISFSIEEPIRKVAGAESYGSLGLRSGRYIWTLGHIGFGHPLGNMGYPCVADEME